MSKVKKIEGLNAHLVVDYKNKSFTVTTKIHTKDCSLHSIVYTIDVDYLHVYHLCVIKEPKFS